MRILLAAMFLVCSLAAQPGFAQESRSTDSVQSDLKNRVEELSSTLDQNPTVRDVSTGILDPIYRLSEYMAHPWFYWLAFALMIAGTVSFAGQLILTKFFLLFKLSLNFGEILGDALGLVISLVGLVLTTHAATEDKYFTSSPAAVVSSAAVGVILGVLFYIWGQNTEFRAARRRATTSAAVSNPPKMR